MVENWQEYIEEYHSYTNWNHLNQSTGTTNQDVYTQSETNFPSTILSHSYPKIDLYREADNLVVETELPGMEKKEIQVSIENGSLIIKGHFQTIKPKVHYYVKERLHLAFEKRIPLPSLVDERNVRSSFQTGVLKLILPITEPDDELVEIPINNTEIP